MTDSLSGTLPPVQGTLSHPRGLSIIPPPCLKSRRTSSGVPRHFEGRLSSRKHIVCSAEHGTNVFHQARQAVLVAFISFAASFGSPLQAEAKRPEPPPPPPTAYDELQKIISGRSGNTGSLLESFKKTVTAPVSGIVESVQPSLPAAPQLSGPKSSEAKSNLPFKAADAPSQANAAVKEVQKGADQAVEASPEFGSSQPLLFALAAAVVGFGGFKVFTNRQGNVASKPNRAARGSKQQIKKQAGTKGIGGAAKRAANKSPKPLQNAFQSSKARAKQPAKKGSGGLFGIGKASSPKQAAKKIVPKATKKIQRSGTAKIGTQKPGTKRIGGTKKIGGTRKIGAGQPASRRLQLDEETSSTLGAAGVVGLGFAVAAFVGFSLVATDDSATAQEAVKDAVSKLGDIPAVIADSGKGPQDTIASAQNAAPDVKGPDIEAPVQEAQKTLEKAPNAVASVAAKAPEEAAKNAPDPVAKVAEKADGEGTPDKPAEVPAPDPLDPKTDAPKNAVNVAQKEVPEAVAEVAEAPKAVAEVARAPETEVLAPKTPDESLTKPPPAVERSPDTTTLRKGAVENASRQKASQTAAQSADQPKSSAAFEAATKKLSSGESSADLFAKTRAAEQQKFEEEANRIADKVAGKEPQAKSSKGGASTPAKATQAASKAASTGGNNSGLILGALAAAGVVGLAVAAPKDGAAGAANQAASAAKETASSAKETAQSGSSPGSSSNGSDSGETDIKDDIASRKKEAQQWISEWREATGGK